MIASSDSPVELPLQFSLPYTPILDIPYIAGPLVQYLSHAHTEF